MAMTAATTASGAVRIPSPFPLTDVRGVRVHMIGIGGAGMAGLAHVLSARGACLSGSDLAASSTVARLAANGAQIVTSQRVEDLPREIDLIVATAAIPDDHCQLLEARRRGIPLMKYSQALGAVAAPKLGVAVSGTHGKSTSSAWVTFVLKRAGHDPSFIIGADVEQLGGSSGTGDGKHFVVEACEYDRSFLNLRPACAAILNIDADHLDCFADMASIERAFADFAALLPGDGLLVINGDDPRCRAIAANATAPAVDTFGTADDSDWQAADISNSNGHYEFRVIHRGEMLGRVRLGIAGRHNVSNALGVIAMAHWCGVAWDDIRDGLGEFRGAERRMTLRGEVGGVRVVDDFGHHPTEVRVTLAAVRERYAPRRLWCVFQPHQYSRTRAMLDDFSRSFGQADIVIVPEIYGARDSDDDRNNVGPDDLVAGIMSAGGAARHIADFSDIAELIAEEVGAGDVVLTMGAGTVWKVADALLERLRSDLSA